MAEKPTYEDLEKRIRELENAEHEREQTEFALHRRLEFEQLVKEISSEFAGAGGGNSIDSAINRALSSVGTFTGADRAYIFRFKDVAARADNTHEWCAEDIKPQIDNLKDIPIDEELPWFTKHIRNHEVFHVPKVAALPHEALLERKHFGAQNIQSLIVVPMETTERLIGFLGFDAVTKSRTWSEDDKDILQFLAQTLSHVIERKMVEDALRESEEKYRRLVENVLVGVYQVEKEGKFITANRKMAEMFGYDFPKQLLTDVDNIANLYARPEERPAVLREIDEKGFVTEKKIEFRKRDGSPIWIKLFTAVSKDKKNKIYEGLMQDVTEQKRLEEQLQQAQKMEAMGLMAGGVAHDLNNILSGIVSYPELLLMDLPEDSPLRKPIKTIQESGMRAADVVADLLTIARGVATGKETLNLNTSVNEYLGSAEYQRLEETYSFVNFKTELAPDLLNMSGSPTHIKKILMNLVTNASEAVEGSGSVTISTESRYLDEPLSGYEDVRTGEYVILTVSDDGSGISHGDLERIFEPFYTKKIMGRSGTGLGLAVVWNTVQDHSGYINVESSVKGTFFELYFPVIRQAVVAEKENVPLEDYLGHGEKILVVDDEERQREIACGILTRLGYNPEAVSSGEEAIEYVKENPVDLILLDMVMPKGINGRKTYEEIIKIRPGQKAIIASGYAKTKEVDLAQKLGAGKYIKKPYALGKVGVAVKKELEK